eukprot:588908-Prymnesium_polylepis.2
MVSAVTLRVRNILIRVTIGAMVAVVRVVLMCIGAGGRRSDEDERGSCAHHDAKRTVSLRTVSMSAARRSCVNGSFNIRTRRGWMITVLRRAAGPAPPEVLLAELNPVSHSASRPSGPSACAVCPHCHVPARDVRAVSVVCPLSSVFEHPTDETRDDGQAKRPRRGAGWMRPTGSGGQRGTSKGDHWHRCDRGAIHLEIKTIAHGLAAHSRTLTTFGSSAGSARRRAA